MGEKGVHTVVRGLDASHRLFRGTRVEAYVNMTASDIVQKVAQRAGLEAKVDATTTAARPHHARTASTTGTSCAGWPPSTTGCSPCADGKLEFARGRRRRRLPAGSAGSRDGPARPRARGEPRAPARHDHLRRPGPRGRGAGLGPGAEEGARRHAGRQDPERRARQRRHAGVAGRDVRRARRTSSGLASVEQQAAVDADRRLARRPPGRRLRRAGGYGARQPRSSAPGRPSSWSASATSSRASTCSPPRRHEFSPDHGYRTSFCASNASERSLYGTDQRGRPATRPQISGVVPAIVTSVKDPDKLGRVKIKLPWLADSYESWWARTVQPGAGKDRGAAVLPEVGDEVLVAFAQGDLEHPYVLGGLYNGEDKPHGGWAPERRRHPGEVVKARLRVAHRHGPRVPRDAPAPRAWCSAPTAARRRSCSPRPPRRAIEILSEGPVKVQAKQAVGRVDHRRQRHPQGHERRRSRRPATSSSRAPT